MNVLLFKVLSMYTYLCNKQPVTCRVMQCNTKAGKWLGNKATSVSTNSILTSRTIPLLALLVGCMASFILYSGLIPSLASPSLIGLLMVCKGKFIVPHVTHLHSCYMYLEYGVREYCNVIGQCLDSRILSGLEGASKYNSTSTVWQQMLTWQNVAGAPPGKKRSSERSWISWAYYPKAVKTNEIVRSVIIT